MKKVLICLMFLFVSSVAFADTLTVIKGGTLTDKTYAVKYENMKMTTALTATRMGNNEYTLTTAGIYYKIDGKLYLTSMFEVEFDE